MKRAKVGYEEQLGRESEKALEVTCGLIMMNCLNNYPPSRRRRPRRRPTPKPSPSPEITEKVRDLLKRMESALGEENAVILNTLNEFGNRPHGSGEPEEATDVYERCLAGRMKMLGEDHKLTLESLNN